MAFLVWSSRRSGDSKWPGTEGQRAARSRDGVWPHLHPPQDLLCALARRRADAARADRAVYAHVHARDVKGHGSQLCIGITTRRVDADEPEGARQTAAASRLSIAAAPPPRALSRECFGSSSLSESVPNGTHRSRSTMDACIHLRNAAGSSLTIKQSDPHWHRCSMQTHSHNTDTAYKVCILDLYRGMV
eukprot:6194703-Pleurochrysis_carterae.AAC.2